MILLSDANRPLAFKKPLSLTMTAATTGAITAVTKTTTPYRVVFADGSRRSANSGGATSSAYASSTSGSIKLYSGWFSSRKRFSSITITSPGAFFNIGDAVRAGSVGFTCNTDNTIFGDLSVPTGMSSFICGGTNTITATSLALPAGMDSFICAGNNTLAGPLSLNTSLRFFDVQGANALSGTLTLNSNIRTFTCVGANTLTGALTFPSLITFFRCEGNNTLSGALTFPATLTTCSIRGNNTISGSLTIPSTLTTLVVVGSNTISGPLTIPSTMLQIAIAGSNTLSGATALPSTMTLFDIQSSAPGSGFSDITIPGTNVCGMFRHKCVNGLPQASVDAILQALAGNSVSNGNCILDGSNAAPSAAGNTAKSTLIGRGWSVLTN